MEKIKNSKGAQINKYFILEKTEDKRFNERGDKRGKIHEDLAKFKAVEAWQSRGEEGGMKVIGFNGSPRKDGNTSILIKHVFNELERQSIGTELVQLSEKEIRGCIACYKCIENKDRRCAVKNDAANEYIEKMLGAEGMILGSPVYFNDVTPEMKALIDRTGYVARANGRMFKNKVGASVAAVRRSGAVHTLDTINHFFLSGEMIVAGRVIGVGRERGEVEKDEEGMQLAKTLGQRMAWLLKKIHG
jgi:multimeric flavodoxin WrbA